MINKVKAFIKENNLIKPNSRVVIALSGGVDSMTLFYALKELGYDLVIAHVNHKKRLESELEEEQIISLANNLKIPCEVLHLEKVDGNFQSEAHHKRYDFFKEVCSKYNTTYLATAHHADDNIETILLNIMSGSNLYGYGGMMPTVNIEGINIIRPLLFLSKKDIKEYALKNNIKYYEDYSNSTDDYTRNRLRHHVIPKIKDECNNILDKINDYSTILHESFEYIRNDSISYLDKHNNQIDLSDYNNLHIALKKDILCLLLERYELEKSNEIINTLIDIINNSKPQLDYNLKNNYIFKKRYQTCFIELDSNTTFNYQINDKNDVVDTAKYKIYLTNKLVNDNVKYIKLCYNSIVFPITIRNRQDGDKIKLSSGHKKLKDLFIDKKVVKEDRDSTPIVIDGNNNILWVYDIAKSYNIFEYRDKQDIYLVFEEK